MKIHLNAQQAGQSTEFHKDYYDDNHYTCVLFSSPSWDTQWGGEFVVCDHDDNNRYTLVPYIPNTAALIKASYDHYGNCPNSFATKIRTTIAFSYILANKGGPRYDR